QAHQVVIRGQEVFVVQPGAALHPGAGDKIAHAVQDPEKGALAALGGAHEAENLPGVDRERQVGNGRKIAVVEGEVFDPDFGLGLVNHKSSRWGGSVPASYGGHRPPYS